VDPRASQDVKAKNIPLGLPGFESLSFSPQPNYYTDHHYQLAGPNNDSVYSVSKPIKLLTKHSPFPCNICQFTLTDICRRRYRNTGLLWVSTTNRRSMSWLKKIKRTQKKRKLSIWKEYRKLKMKRLIGWYEKCGFSEWNTRGVKKRREMLKIIGHDNKIFAPVIYRKTVTQNNRQCEKTINIKS